MNQSELTAEVDALFADSAAAIQQARQQLSGVVAVAARKLGDVLANDGKILICGNGGSAADSAHFSSELINKFMRVRKPLAAISLAVDAPTLTSIANDESYDAVFAKQVEALARSGDVVVVITTSGNSPSILRAAQSAHALGATCIALNGQGGGKLSTLLREDDIDIIAPGDSTARVQEIHGIIIHAFCQLIDRQLFGELRQ